MIHHTLLGMIAVALFACFSSASASTFVITEDELHPEIFPKVAESIRANLDGPNSPPGLSRARKADIRQSLDALEELLVSGSVAPTSERARALQARINTHLLPQVATNDGKSEVVCRRIKRVGSNIPSTECRTRAEMATEQHQAHDTIQRLQLTCGLESCRPSGN